MAELKNVAPLADFDWNAYESGDTLVNESREAQEKAYEGSLNKVNDHEVVDGTVIAMNKREVVAYMPEIRQRDGEHAGKTDRIHRGYRPKEKGSNSRFILILIALVFLSPFIITAASGVFSILLVVILFPFLAIFVSGVVAFAFIVAACACMSVGVGTLVTNTAVGLLVMGIGCLLFASGILFCILTGWLGSTIFPWILRKVTDFLQKIVYRNKKEEQA